MGIFLRFSRSKLAQASICNYFAQNIAQILRLERHLHWKVRIVLGKCAKSQWLNVFALEATKVCIYKGLSELPCPVGTEVEENYAVIRFNCTRSDPNRLDKLVGDLLIIRSLN